MKGYRRHKGRREHFHGTAAIDFYACQSGIRCWNGCFKVISTVLILVMCLALDAPVVSGFIILTMGALKVKRNRVRFKDYLVLLKIPIVFLVLGSLTAAVEISADPLGNWRVSLYGMWLYISKAGIWRAAELFLKTMGAVSAMYFLALSTPAGELAAALQRLHIPRLFTELMHMIYRFIFILTEVQRTMKMAAVSRLGDVDFKTSCTTFGLIGGNLLILSLKKANLYYDAMVSRGYKGEFFFWEEEKNVKAWQVLLLLCYLTALMLLRLAEEI